MSSKHDALVDFAEGVAFCPRCGGVYSCARGCAIRNDSMGSEAGRVRYQTMLAARRALAAYRKRSAK